MSLTPTSANAAPDKQSPPADTQGPEKYIRTFAGDMEILKKGGTPDLAPLGSPPADEPSPQPDPLKVSVPSLAQAVTPAPSVVVPKPPQVSPLKTYSGDFTDRIKETNASTATVLAAEQDSGAQVPRRALLESPGSNLLYIIASVILVIAGIGGIYAAYIHYRSLPEPVVVAPTIPAPIFVDEREEVSGTGSALIYAMKESVNRPLASGTVRLLYMASSTNPSSVFAALAALSAPDILLRNIHASGSMAGVIQAGGNQSPFFILSVASYSETFAGLLAWEPVLLLYLADLFPPYPAPQASVAPVSTTTAATTTKKAAQNAASSTTSLQVVAPPAPAAQFFDTTVANHDARIYRDASGRPVLVYGYWNHTTLVIARDAATFTEILARLATARALE